MRPIFTVHAGEFLVGREIEQRLPHVTLWVPARDAGIDLLVTRGQSFMSLQVKLSQNYPVDGWRAFSWFSLRGRELRESKADLWILAISGNDPRRPWHLDWVVVIPPKELYKRLHAVHGRKERYHVYLCINEKGELWETRGLLKNQRDSLKKDSFGDSVDSKRNFTHFLNNWSILRNRFD